ncbi:SDR family NAD(P)-dependent oxidoreductase [Micromonospora polyrhachis]|uniref:NAD(P)-dependent dehydrogenase (Short-subunit alcohol dehydrogenase family) n=1 Tax=Micromonospora polyrhachis TaxID=1282883 RepID=A0A7W7WSM8_9ACTN|nr:SDR family NAD(P)-dependent oxidoreductase [Micromonospora polyrhachis]MBB4961802.1 NAD(P)-dependent dehydrogenase (short-subunit alcohol dehydrogenase family) [Micromonospora polyrhachis]
MNKGTALIVGAGPGLGRELARTFALDGHPVAVLNRNLADVETWVADLNEEGHTVHGYQADATRFEQLRAVLGRAVDELGAPEVLIYNAAWMRPDRPLDVSAEEWSTSLAVNVTGAAVSAATVIPLMRNGRGSVLFTGGGFALHPVPDFSTLSVGKAGLRALAHLLHAVHVDTDIQVSTVTITSQMVPDGGVFDPKNVAPAYLRLHSQPRDQWQPELVYG